MVDLSSLAFDESTSSKITYCILMVSSFTSVSISLAQVLKCGKTLVIKHFFCLKFFKIIILMITRFIVQSYILSMAIKSLMFFVVFTNIFEKEYQNEEFRQLFDVYYRGLCNPPRYYEDFCAASFSRMFT